MGYNIVRAILIAIVTAVVLLAALWVGLFVTKPGPKGHIVMATGGSGSSGTAYAELAATFVKDLAPKGVSVEIRKTGEGFDTLKALIDDKTDISAGFVKGGLFGSLRGRLASAQAKEWHDKAQGKLRSVGRLFYEPIFVFTRGDLPIATLRDLRGKRILVGTKQSGSRRIATQLLVGNGIHAKVATFLEDELSIDASALTSGNADAAFVIVPADSDKIQKLLRVPNIRLMNFAHEADAYVNRFPALSRVELQTGSIEFDPLIPSADITLLATSAALLVRNDLDPALVALLSHTVLTHPRSAFDSAGDPVLFYKPGTFPHLNESEFDVDREARAVYKSGELPLLLRSLPATVKRVGLPFGVAALIHANAAKIILLLIPILSVMLPLLRVVPMVYNWMIRRRLLYWYRHLKALERSLDVPGLEIEHADQLAELERIDMAVRRIRVPLNYSDQFYDLRGHIELVRRRLTPAPVELRQAAE